MAFDVIFARALARELDGVLRGARIEKVYQPSRDELVLFCRTGRETQRLIISASPSSARLGITSAQAENPSAPPMLCMLLRKHLCGSQIISVGTIGFERAVIIAFDCHDELGFSCRKYLIAEIMGKYSNVIFAGDDEGRMKILGAVRTVDFTTSRLRQILPGLTYEAPPAQDKSNPLEETREGFIEKFSHYPPGKDASRFFIDTYSGFSPVVAQELAFRAGAEDICAADANAEKLFGEFSALTDNVKNNVYMPCIVCSPDGKLVEYSYFEIGHFGGEIRKCGSFSELLDTYYGKRASEEALKNRIGATEATVLTAQKRLVKKVTVLEDELAGCDEANKFRLWGDLLTASLYKLGGKARSAEVDNYYEDPMTVVTIPLDEKYSPAQNAARYYKKYNKLKMTKTVASQQLEKARGELNYLASVIASLAFCENTDDVSEIREELIKTGYIHRQNVRGKSIKPKKSEPMRYFTSSGREVICGKNNTQNDLLSTRIADRSDYWFHVKSGAGSHVIMKCADGEDPDAQDFTEAAQAAAYFSDLSGSENVAVDYTRVKFVKKPSGSAPGHVIYTDYYTAYVNPLLSLKRK